MACSRTVAVPAACRPPIARPGVSMPWSTALRTRCSSGVGRAGCSTPRSSSVSSPRTSQRTSLPVRAGQVAHRPLQHVGDRRRPAPSACASPGPAGRSASRDSSLNSATVDGSTPRRSLDHPADAQVRRRRLADQADELVEPLDGHPHRLGIRWRRAPPSRRRAAAAGVRVRHRRRRGVRSSSARRRQRPLDGQRAPARRASLARRARPAASTPSPSTAGEQAVDQRGSGRAVAARGARSSSSSSACATRLTSSKPTTAADALQRVQPRGRSTSTSSASVPRRPRARAAARPGSPRRSSASCANSARNSSLVPGRRHRASGRRCGAAPAAPRRRGARRASPSSRYVPERARQLGGRRPARPSSTDAPMPLVDQARPGPSAVSTTATTRTPAAPCRGRAASRCRTAGRSRRAG